MRRTRLILAVVGTAALALPASAQQYSARRDGDVVQLQDAKAQTVVSILPTVGNIVFDMTVKGHKVLRWPLAAHSQQGAHGGDRANRAAVSESDVGRARRLQPR